MMRSVGQGFDGRDSIGGVHIGDVKKTGRPKREV